MGLDLFQDPLVSPKPTASTYADITSGSGHKSTPKKTTTTSPNGNSQLTVLGGKKKKKRISRARSLLLSSSDSSSEEESLGTTQQESKNPEAELREKTEADTQEKERKEGTSQDKRDDAEPLTEEQQDAIFLPFEEEKAGKTHDESSDNPNSKEELPSPPTPGNLSSDTEEKTADISEEGEIKSSSTSPESLIDKEFSKIKTSTPGEDPRKNAARTWEERGSPSGNSPQETKEKQKKKRTSSSHAAERSSGIPRPRGKSLETKERTAWSDTEGRGRNAQERKGNSRNSNKYQERSLSQVKKKLRQ